MSYHDLDEVQAKFVRITRDSRAPLTAITELELYASHLLTFENDAITTIPRTIKDARYALVADKGTVPGYDHSNARMVLIDADQAGRATATIPARRRPPGSISASASRGTATVPGRSGRSSASPGTAPRRSRTSCCWCRTGRRT